MRRRLRPVTVSAPRATVTAGTSTAGRAAYKIRAELLKQTPPGSSTDEVLRFIAKTLPPKPGTPAPTLEVSPASGPAAAASGHAGTQRIRIVLGDYVDNPAFLLQGIPLAIEKQVIAQWAFDADGRLLDVFVDKKTELGD